MDSFGHVNNVVYLRYLEQARVEWMFMTAKESGIKEFSLGTVVARHEIEYKRPLVYRSEPVRVETWVTRCGRAASAPRRSTLFSSYAAKLPSNQNHLPSSSSSPSQARMWVAVRSRNHRS